MAARNRTGGQEVERGEEKRKGQWRKPLLMMVAGIEWRPSSPIENTCKRSGWEFNCSEGFQYETGKSTERGNSGENHIRKRFTT